MVGGGRDGVALHDVATGRVVKRWGGHRGLVRALAFAPDGRRLVSGGVDASLLVWDVVVGAFLFIWWIGLITTLQRSEAVSLDKFLHLPVSLGGAFALNYVSSLLNVSLILFVPVMVGLSLGLVFSNGPVMLLLLPLVAALLLAITAITYQFQGWLASLMVNKRLRRTVIALVTMGLVIVVQLPNLLNVFFSERTLSGEVGVFELPR